MITLEFLPPSEDALPAMLASFSMVSCLVGKFLIPAKMLSGLSEPRIYLLLSNSCSKHLQPGRMVANRTGPVLHPSFMVVHLQENVQAYLPAAGRDLHDGRTPQRGRRRMIEDDSRKGTEE